MGSKVVMTRAGDFRDTSKHPAPPTSSPAPSRILVHTILRTIGTFTVGIAPQEQSYSYENEIHVGEISLKHAVVAAVRGHGRGVFFGVCLPCSGMG